MHPRDWRFERGDEKTVAAARRHACEGAGGIAAEPIRDKPLSPQTGCEIAADLAAESVQGLFENRADGLGGEPGRGPLGSHLPNDAIERSPGS